MTLSSAQSEIIAHAIGVDRFGDELNPGYRRNRFVTGSTCTDGKICQSLVAAGLMEDRGSFGELTGGDNVYCVTEAGRRLFFASCPKKPPQKPLTASQERYQRFIESDSGLTFREWLGIK